MATDRNRLKVMVLAGGPDRERPVSLLSGAAVAAALTQAGHDVRQRDVGPKELACLDEFASWPGDVIFPALHGAWGEGGGLQTILDTKGVSYVGSRAPAAALCMDKAGAKRVMIEHHLPTPPFEVLAAGQRRKLEPPVVVKPPCEGSSIDLAICQDADQFSRARKRIGPRHPRLLVEKFIAGRELTVGVIEGELGLETLPPIHIIPATEFYDYDAKYDRNDTQYKFDIDLPGLVLEEVQRVSLEAAKVLGCRHFCRVDVMVDHAEQPWILEVNTIPGFTSHSLLPKAAAHAGIPMAELVDRLVRMAIG